MPVELDLAIEAVGIVVRVAHEAIHVLPVAREPETRPHVERLRDIELEIPDERPGLEIARPVTLERVH